LVAQKLVEQAMETLQQLLVHKYSMVSAQLVAVHMLHPNG
jgi:hypothetical protein